MLLVIDKVFYRASVFFLAILNFCTKLLSKNIPITATYVHQLHLTYLNYDRDHDLDRFKLPRSKTD